MNILSCQHSYGFYWSIYFNMSFLIIVPLNVTATSSKYSSILLVYLWPKVNFTYIKIIFVILTEMKSTVDVLATISKKKNLLVGVAEQMIIHV